MEVISSAVAFGSQVPERYQLVIELFYYARGDLPSPSTGIMLPSLSFIVGTVMMAYR
jgi:hypothetical protein